MVLLTWWLLIVTVFSAVIGGVMIKTKKDLPPVICTIGMACGFGFLAQVASGVLGHREGSGHLDQATAKLEVGQTFQCLAEPVEIKDKGWYALVRTGRADFALWFEEKPPMSGVVASQDGKMVFLPLGESQVTAGTTIPNPLAEQPANKPAEKPEEK